MENSKMTAYILLGYLGIRADDVIVTYDALFYLGPGLDTVPIADLGVVDVGFDAEDVVASDTHYIVFLCRLEHNNRSFLDDVVIPKDNLEVLIFFLADNRASRINYAPFTEGDIPYNLIEP